MKDKIAACAHVIGDKKGKLVSLQNTNLIDIYFQILNLARYLTRVLLAECQYIICWYCNRSQHRLYKEGKIPEKKLSLWEKK